MATTNPYGNDVTLSDGDFVTDSSGDFLSVDVYESLNADTTRFPGYYAIIFDLTDRLTTQKGDHIFHPDYGSELMALLASPNSPNLKNKAESAVRNTIMKDARIEKVSYVEIKQNAGFVNISAGIILSGNSQAFDFVFPTFIID